MIRTFILILILFVSFPFDNANAQKFSHGGRSGAMGDASTTFTDIFSLLNNQAGLATLEKVTFGLASEKRAIGGSPNAISLVAGIPTTSGNFGLSVQYFGYHLYNEQKIGLAFARKLGSRFSLGVQFDYLGVHISGLGDKNTFTFEGGFQYQLFNELRIGVHIYNPLRIRLEQIDLGADNIIEEYLPTVFTIGFGYEPSKKLLITTELRKNIDFKPSFSVGIEYKVTEIFRLRTGFNSESSSASFGIGLHLKKLNIDLASTFHPVLGYTPGLGITHQFKQKNANKE